ncbi:MAE_28990/MAE_18760 family HEPN-like nuclease [Pseudomonas putida]|uniref:MAE_28990/MAE_18760 family HEPN-like nuclease n=1 Tax=Pseudomonas putida TaxID=303 RepID=UPI000E1B6A27|nr:MAE_28990/MAE_18760 family HEPN-like nuclease [Pseudomonas putida]
MEELNAAFAERLGEVEEYIDFLKLLEVSMQAGPPRLSGTEHAINVQQQKMLYAGVYLQLYNLVESTMTRCIDFIAQSAFKDGTWRPDDLSQTLFREWIRLTARTHVELTPEHRLNHALALCDALVTATPLTEFSIEKGGGGNWDDTEIEAMAIRLGFQLNVSQQIYSDVKRKFRDDLGPLGLVKKLRNKLAHGSISFTESAETETVARLIDLKDKTANYLKEVILCFGGYVERYEFLKPERRPA